MKIGIDARMIDNLGIGTYIKNLIYWLPKISNNQYILYGDPQKLEKYNITVVKSNFPVYGVGEQIFFPNIIKKSKIDLFHSTHYAVPLMYSKKMVVNIYDLIHLIYPEYLPSKFAYFYARFMISSACKKAKKIITISENTKSDIIKFFNIDSSKIEIIYPAVDENFKVSYEYGKSAGKKYGKYLLYVGAIRPHKNILYLIDVFHKLIKDRKITHKLILIGKGKIPYIDDVRKKISACSLDNEISIIEDIQQEDLVRFYCGAELFVFPSLYEGFGLPPLEAMACGCPVITSNSSSLPEVIGDAGLMVAPNNVDELASAIYKVLTDEQLRKNLIEKGIKRIELFSWENMAKKTLKIYEEVLE